MPARVDYIGTRKCMNNGQYATVIIYYNSKDMTIQFEDGTIVEHVRKKHFDDGKVANPNFYKEKCIGLTNKMSNGQLATIIAYTEANDMTIQFEDGTIVEHVRKRHFDDGAISNPNLRKYQARIDAKSILGLSKKMNCGKVATVIDYIDSMNITVQFETGDIVYNVVKKSFLDGNIACPSLTKYYANTERTKLTGVTKQMNNGLFCTVIEDNGNSDITVQFEDKTIVKHVRRASFKRGSVAHPLRPSVSLMQLYIYYWCYYYFRDTLINYRPDWLKSPITQKNLELDIYIPSKHFAIEYDGAIDRHIQPDLNTGLKLVSVDKTQYIDTLIAIKEKGTLEYKSAKLKNIYLSEPTIEGKYNYPIVLKELSVILQDILLLLGINNITIHPESIASLTNFNYNIYITNLYNKLFELGYKHSEE